MSGQHQRDVTVIDREDIRSEKPRLYNVVFLNDDFTTMDFVTDVLTQLFNKSTEEAERITMAIHEKGQGIAGTYTRDIAGTKQAQAMDRARREDHPLQVKLQPTS